jgi:hypothetical protein
MFSFILGRYIAMEFLNHMINIYLNFKEHYRMIVRSYVYKNVEYSGGINVLKWILYDCICI